MGVAAASISLTHRNVGGIHDSHIGRNVVALDVANPVAVGTQSGQAAKAWWAV